MTKDPKLFKLLGIPSSKSFGENRCIKKFNRLSACLYSITSANKKCLLKRASLHDPGLDTDPGHFSVAFYVYMIPG